MIRHFLFGAVLCAALLTLSAPGAKAGEVRFCNESSSDVELNFVYQQAIDLFFGKWRGGGPFPLRARSCESFFSVEQLYSVMVNAQETGFLGNKQDVDLSSRNLTVETRGGQVKQLANHYCLSNVESTNGAAYEEIQYFYECEQKNLNLFSLWVSKGVGEDVRIIIR